MQIMDFASDRGVPFRALHLDAGEDGPNKARTSPTEARIEFYDRRYPHTEHGQYVADYYRRSLLERVDGDPLTGLLLWPGTEPDWVLDAATMSLVLAWLLNCRQAKAVP